MPLDSVERKLWRESHAAEKRPKRIRMLDAITLEETMAAIIHLHWELHHHFAFWLRENDLLVMPKSHQLRRMQQSLRRFMEKVSMLRREPDFLEDP